MAELGHLQGAEVAHGLVQSRDGRGIEGLEIVIAMLLHRNASESCARQIAEVVAIVKANLKLVIAFLADLLGYLNLVLVKDVEDQPIIRLGTAMLNLGAVIGL